MNKQVQEIKLSSKTIKLVQSAVQFNDTPVACANTQKHIGSFLDEKLFFSHHLKGTLDKGMKGVNVIRKTNNVITRHSPITIYKSFVRAQLDYEDIVFDQPNNDIFCQIIESMQYNVALAITGTIKGTFRCTIYKELGLETLKFRQWFRRLYTLLNIKAISLPKYLFKLITQ